MRKNVFRNGSLLYTVIIMLGISGLTACTQASEKVPTLIWWQVGNRQASFAQDEKVISDYIESKIGVRVEFRIAGWADALTRLNTVVNAGEYFDIMFIDRLNYNRFVTMGAFADITDLVPEAVPALNGVIPEILWDGVRINGRIFSVPTYKDSSATGFYFWDAAFVKKYNIDLTRSGWAYLDEAFRRVKAGEGQRFYPFYLARGKSTHHFSNYDDLTIGFSPIGVRMDDQNRRVVFTLTQPDVMESLRYFHSWFQDGIINPDANLVQEVPMGRMFILEQAWPSVAVTFAKQEGIERYEPASFFGPYLSTGTIQGSMNAISANSRNKEEALRLLELVNTDTTLRDMLAYGIEGKNFNYAEVDGRRVVHQLNTDTSLANYQQGNFFIVTPADDVPATYWDEVRQQNENAVPSVMMGFVMDQEPIMTELANVGAIWDRYRVDLTFGVIDPDEALPEIIEQMKAAGLDKIIEESQKQVDAFVANQN